LPAYSFASVSTLSQ